MDHTRSIAALLIVVGSLAAAGCNKGAPNTACKADADCYSGYYCASDLRCTATCREDRHCAQGQVCDRALSRCVTACVADASCAAGQRCSVDGRCRPPCKTDDDCGAGQGCGSGSGRCFPNWCGTATCAQGQVCVEGACADAACAGVSCTAPATCLRGACFSPVCQDKPCPAGSVCDGKVCVARECAGIACPTGSTCVRGACQPNACAAPCPAGLLCVDGACLTPECAAAACASGETCIAGSCYPASCADTPCAPGEVCARGRCESEACVTAACPDSSACVAGACFAYRCGGASLFCPVGELCVGGACARAGCARCTADQTCIGGECVTDQCEAQTCGADQACLAGACADKDCVGVRCASVHEVCRKGACWATACGSYSCGEGKLCLSGVCGDAECAGVDCPAGTRCSKGACQGSAESLYLGGFVGALATPEAGAIGALKWDGSFEKLAPPTAGPDSVRGLVRSADGSTWIAAAAGNIYVSTDGMANWAVRYTGAEDCQMPPVVTLASGAGGRIWAAATSLSKGCGRLLWSDDDFTTFSSAGVDGVGDRWRVAVAADGSLFLTYFWDWGCRNIGFALFDPTTQALAGKSSFCSNGSDECWLQADAVDPARLLVMCTIESRLSTDSSVHWSNNGVVPLYAGAGRFAYAQSLQAPDKMFWAAGSHGIFKSTDRGLNWGQRQSGIPADALARSLTLRQADQTLFVFVDGDPAIGLLKSGDDGETFVDATADMVAAGLASAGGAPMHVDSLWQPSLADACRTGLTLCQERCVDTRSDRANCGACANACSAEETCTSTGCVLSGCNAGQRAGLVDPARWPKIAACAGRFADALDKGGGAELCAPGWHVCTASDASLRSLGYLAATSFPGCFAADASDDAGRCGVLACSVYASDDVAGAGADCALLAGAAWPGVGGCLADGRVEAVSGSAERLGCWQVPGVDGVLCCQD